jgi:hypothetical protein
MVSAEDMLGLRSDAIMKDAKLADGDPAAILEDVEAQAAYYRAMARGARENPVVLRAFVVGFYGSTLELFQLFAKMGLSSGITPEYVKFVNDNLLQLVIMRELLDAYSGDELLGLLDTGARKAVISSAR